MIGDRKHDVLGAKECRVPCIGVRYGYAEAGELEQYGADWVTDSVETLGKLLL
jgi:phosphoglycolate phosphatase